jgi:hypothetical protein
VDLSALTTPNGHGATRTISGPTEATIATTPADLDEQVYVQIGATDQLTGPCRWTPRDGVMPRRGDACVVEPSNTGHHIIQWFGGTFPVPTGADDAGELLSRLNSGEHLIELRASTYRWQQPVVLPDGARLIGSGKYATEVLHEHDGDMLALGSEGGFSHLTLDGQGDSHAGRGVVMGAGKARQYCEHFQIIDFADRCLDFDAVDAGSQSIWFNGTLAQLIGAAIGQEAIRVHPAQQLAATPRKFIACESNGKRFIDLGGCNNLFIVDGGYIAEIVFTAESRGVVISGVRLGGTYTAESGILHVKGHNIAISGCDVGPDVVIDAGYTPITLQANTYNGTVIDNSGNPHLNLVDHPKTTYTPTLTTGGSAPSLGDGTLSGSWSRHGASVTFEIQLTIGSTTSLGTGDLRFALPLKPTSGGVIRIVPVFVYDASTNLYYSGTGLVLVSNEGYVTLRNAGGLNGAMTSTSPVTFAAGDVIRISGTYDL